MLIIQKSGGQLQSDKNIRYLWSLNNQMKFHSDKSKVVTSKLKPSPLAMLAFVAYRYQLAETLLYYADSENDLSFRCVINESFHFNERCENICM